MSDDAKTLRDLEEVQQSLSAHIRAENRRDPARAAVRIALLQDWLSIINRAEDVLMRRPEPSPKVEA